MLQRLLLIALCVLGTAAAAQEVVVDGIKYSLDADNHTAKVILKDMPYQQLPAPNQYTGDIVIPPTITDNSIEYTVTTIGNWAFYTCYGLTSIELPNTIKTIEPQAFYQCTGLTSITLPEGLESINDWAFQYCSGLESLVIPNSVQSIGVGMCDGCTNLKYIDLQSATPDMQTPWFFGPYKDFNNQQLTEFRVAENNQRYSQIDGVLCNKAQTELLVYPPGHGEHYTIPSSITTIKEWAFQGCVGLKTVEIPNTVTSIENHAFSESGLVSVAIPSSISVIDSLCFYHCNNLQSVDLGNVATIKYGAFSFCQSLTSITIPSTVKTIGNSAFGNSGLTDDLDIPSTVEELGDFAFAHNAQLKTVKCVITNESEGLFAGCSSMESADLTNSLLVPKSCFDNCTNLSDVTFNNQIRKIEHSAFFVCSSLQDITLYDGLEYIGVNAFALTGLESIEIPNTVTTIMQGAFQQCSNLSSVTLPNQLEILPPMIFAKCSSLESIEIPNSVTNFDDGTMGTQDVASGAPGYQFSECVSLSSVILSNRLQNISDYAFAVTGLTEIEIPSNVGKIGDFAFAQSPLEYIELPKNLKKTPGEMSFMGCPLAYMKSYLLAPNPETFMGGWADGTLYIPQETTEIYEDWDMYDWCLFPDIIEATPLELEGEYRTFCSWDDLDFSEVEGLEAYVASKFADGTLTMRRVYRVPEGVGVVLKGEPGFYEIPYPDDTEAIGTNLLVGLYDGALVPATDGEKANWLMDDEGEYTAADGSRVSYHHAYLQLPADAGEVTNIVWTEGSGYDLNGDGAVDIADVNICINIILELETDPVLIAAADFTGDGKVDISDVNELINVILAQ